MTHSIITWFCTACTWSTSWPWRIFPHLCTKTAWI